MNFQKIEKLLDPKNQNLPKLDLGHSFAKRELVVIPVVEGAEKDVTKIFKDLKNVSGKKGETQEVVHKGQLLKLEGLGKPIGITARTVRRFYGKTYLTNKKAKTISFYCPPEWVEMATIGVQVAALSPDLLKPSKTKPAANVSLTHPEFRHTVAPWKKAMKAGQVTAEAKNLMRILGTAPPNLLHPQSYASLVQKLCRKWKVKCKRANKAELKKYEVLNAVSLGSAHHSELLIMTIHPKKGKTKKSTAYLGKGICYDSGGIIGKQDHMRYMKEDMAGSAGVLATVYNIVKQNLKVKETTHFVLALAENMMGAHANRPDDIWNAGDGQTVEIAHPDAEGRLVLGDAVCYMKKNYPEVSSYFTIATLTGSCIRALGDLYTGVVCNNDELAAKVTAEGKLVGDYCHAAPFDLDYDDFISPIASMSNLGQKAGEAGWIKAGLYMYKFVPKDKNGNPKANYCHFDIAGSIDMEEKGAAWRQKGFSSGVLVGLMTKLLTK